MKKMWIIILIIILVLLAISFTNVLLFAIRNNNWNWFNGFGSTKDLRKEEYKRKEEYIEIADIKELEIDFKSSDLNLYFTEDDKVRVIQYAYNELKDNETFSVSNSSSSITISENTRPHFFYFNIKAYDVYIPKQYENSLKIKAVSGDIEINEALKFSKLDISSTSGDIKMQDIEAKTIEVESVSGDIRLGNLKEESLKLKTTSGDIGVSSVEGKIEAKTTSGDIFIKDAKGQIEAKSTSGDIVFEQLEGKVDLQTVSGNIECEDFKITGDSNIKTTSGEVKTYLNEESNCEIDTDTVSGNVTLPNRRNVMGKEPYVMLKIKTTSGNIRLEK